MTSQNSSGMWLFLVLVLGLQSRIQEQLLENRDRSWLNEIDLYDEDEIQVGDIYSFEFDDKEEPLGDSSEEEFVIGAPGSADDLEVGSTFLSALISELDADLSEDEEALGADMPDYLFNIDEDEEDDSEEDSEENKVAADDPLENPFSKDDENSFMDYIFGSEADESKEFDKLFVMDSDEIAVGGSSSFDYSDESEDDTKLDNLINSFSEYSTSVENEVSQDENIDGPPEDDDDKKPAEDESVQGLKDMADTILKKQEGKLEKEDMKEKVKKIGKKKAAPKKKLSTLQKLESLKKAVMTKQKNRANEREKLENNVHLSRNPDLLKAMTKMKFQLEKQRKMSEPPSKSKQGPPVLVVPSKPPPSKLTKYGMDGSPLTPLLPAPVLVIPSKPGKSKYAKQPPRKVDPSVLREIEALESRMVDGVGGGQLQKLKDDVNRLIFRESQKDEIAKTDMPGLKKKMLSAMKKRAAKPKKKLTKAELQNKIDGIRETVEQGGKGDKKEVDIQDQVEKLVRELGRGIMSLVNEKAGAKAKVMALGMAKKLAHEMAQQQDEPNAPETEEKQEATSNDSKGKIPSINDL